MQPLQVSSSIGIPPAEIMSIRMRSRFYFRGSCLCGAVPGAQGCALWVPGLCRLRLQFPLFTLSCHRGMTTTSTQVYQKKEDSFLRWPLSAVLALCSSPYFLFQLPAFFSCFHFLPQKLSPLAFFTFSPSFFHFLPQLFSLSPPAFFHFLPQLFSLSPPAFCLVRASGEPRR